MKTKNLIIISSVTFLIIVLSLAVYVGIVKNTIIPEDEGFAVQENFDFKGIDWMLQITDLGEGFGGKADYSFQETGDSITTSLLASPVQSIGVGIIPALMRIKTTNLQLNLKEIESLEIIYTAKLSSTDNPDIKSRFNIYLKGESGGDNDLILLESKNGEVQSDNTRTLNLENLKLSKESEKWMTTTGDTQEVTLNEDIKYELFIESTLSSDCTSTASAYCESSFTITDIVIDGKNIGGGGKLLGWIIVIIAIILLISIISITLLLRRKKIFKK